MTEWKTIDSAPKDGTKILTYGCLHDDGGVDMGETPFFAISSWHRPSESWYSPSHGSHEPTHWMPLPEPPSSQGSAT